MSHALAGILLLSALLVGLGHIALLPPFEGFDETAHYSYIQQIAETGRWPRAGDKMSREIDDYLKVAPTADSMSPPWRYFEFFATPEQFARARDAIHTPPREAVTFVPGAIENWQAQHPPLYYAALAPVYRAAKSLSLAGRLFVLRACSYLFAAAALVITAVFLLRRYEAVSEPPLTLFAICAWPLMFPMWFPEMARLGNDSLVTVFAALLLILATRLASSVQWRDHVLLGLVLSLALLTKAIVLPAVAAMMLMLATLAWSARNSPQERTRRLGGLVLTLAMVLAGAGWWYGLKLVETGSAIGSNDAARMHATGGLIAGLMNNLRPDDLLVLPLGLTMSFFWSGTWSFVLPPRATYLPFVALAALIAYGAFCALRQRKFYAAESLALMLLTFFIAALSYHSLVLLSTASGIAPAWYLHAMAPILSALVGCGFTQSRRSKWLKGALIALLFYPLLFLPAVTMLNALYFAGCAPKLPGRQYLALSRAMECVTEFPRMIDNLAVLAYPRLGIALFIVGWVIALGAMIVGVRTLRTGAHTSITSTR
jgi:hypothetical protein